MAVGDGGRVSVSHGGVEYLSGITLPQWPVGAHWAFGLSAGAIGGQYASANRALQFDNLRLRTPLLAPRPSHRRRCGRGGSRSRGLR